MDGDFEYDKAAGELEHRDKFKYMRIHEINSVNTSVDQTTTKVFSDGISACDIE